MQRPRVCSARHFQSGPAHVSDRPSQQARARQPLLRERRRLHERARLVLGDARDVVVRLPHTQDVHAGRGGVAPAERLPLLSLLPRLRDAPGPGADRVRHARTDLHGLRQLLLLVVRQGPYHPQPMLRHEHPPGALHTDGARRVRRRDRRGGGGPPDAQGVRRMRRHRRVQEVREVVQYPLGALCVQLHGRRGVLRSQDERGCELEANHTRPAASRRPRGHAAGHHERPAVIVPLRFLHHIAVQRVDDRKRLRQGGRVRV